MTGELGHDWDCLGGGERTWFCCRSTHPAVFAAQPGRTGGPACSAQASPRGTKSGGRQRRRRPRRCRCPARRPAIRRRRGSFRARRRCRRTSTTRGRRGRFLGGLTLRIRSEYNKKKEGRGKEVNSLFGLGLQVEGLMLTLYFFIYFCTIFLFFFLFFFSFFRLEKRSPTMTSAPNRVVEVGKWRPFKRYGCTVEGSSPGNTTLFG